MATTSAPTGPVVRASPRMATTPRATAPSLVALPNIATTSSAASPAFSTASLEKATMLLSRRFPSLSESSPSVSSTSASLLAAGAAAAGGAGGSGVAVAAAASIDRAVPAAISSAASVATIGRDEVFMGLPVNRTKDKGAGAGQHGIRSNGARNDEQQPVPRQAAQQGTQRIGQRMPDRRHGLHHRPGRTQLITRQFRGC